MDNGYRATMLQLVASENFPSAVVRFASAARHSSFYYFDPPFKTPPGEWAFHASGAEQVIAEEIRRSGERLFRAKSLDWRPAGGSIAEQAPLLAACRRGDAFAHFSHSDGGHFALESLAERLGLKILHVPVDRRTLLVDVGALATLVRSNPEIRAIILDQSFKLRQQPIGEIRAALPKGVLLTYDCSHDGALIAGGAMANPLLQGADILHGNVHKTIPGPQRAFIAFADPSHPLLKETAEWVCPRLQSNCHAGELGSMLTVFKELEEYGRPYAHQIVENARALAAELRHQGLLVSGESFGFTETHQVWLCLGSAEYAYDVAQRLLPRSGIRTTNIEIPGTNGSHGLRLGTQALTRRGFKAEHCRAAAQMIARVLHNIDPPEQVRAEVRELVSDFPLFPLPYSFDHFLLTSDGIRFLNSISS